MYKVAPAKDITLFQKPIRSSVSTQFTCKLIQTNLEASGRLKPTFYRILKQNAIK